MYVFVCMNPLNPETNNRSSDIGIMHVIHPVWVLGIELRSSERTINALNSWAISSGTWNKFFFFFFPSPLCAGLMAIVFLDSFLICLFSVFLFFSVFHFISFQIISWLLFFSTSFNLCLFCICSRNRILSFYFSISVLRDNHYDLILSLP